MNEKQMLRISIKFNAKKMMDGKLLRFAGVALICLAISFVFSLLQLPFDIINEAGDININNYIITIGISIISLIISAPAMIGLIQYFLKVSNARDANISDLFLWYGEGKKFIKALGIYILYELITILWTIIFMIIPSALFGFIFRGQQSQSRCSRFYLLLYF